MPPSGKGNRAIVTDRLPRRDGPLDLRPDRIAARRHAAHLAGARARSASRRPGADHYFYVETRERAIPNQKRLLAAARSADVEVIHTIIQASPKTAATVRSITNSRRSMFRRACRGPAAAGAGPDRRRDPAAKIIVGVFNSTNLDTS